MNQRETVHDISGIDRYFKNIPDAFFLMQLLLDAHGKPYDINYLYANDSVLDLTGMKKENYIGRRFSEIFGGFPPEKWLEPYYNAAFHDISRTWRDYSDEIQEYVEITCFPCNEGCAGCFVKNVTDKTLYEKTINSSRLAYREIYFLDLSKDHYQLIFPRENDQERGCYSEAIQKHFANGKINPEQEAEITAFLNPDHIRQALSDCCPAN